MSVTERSVAEILDRYERERLPLLKPRTRRDYQRHLVSLRRELGRKSATLLNLDDLGEFMNVPKGKIHRNRALAVLSAAFTEAIRWGYLHSNVCKEVQRHQSKRRQRDLSDEEYNSARSYVNLRTGLVMDLALHTGQLQGQIITLRWAQVQEKKILFRHYKTNKIVEVTITPNIQTTLNACRELQRRQARPEFVISTRHGDPYTSEGFRAMWQRAMRRWKEKGPGYDTFTFHDIRAKWAREYPKSPNGRDIQALANEPDDQILIKPRVFRVPKTALARDAVAVMMPLGEDFSDSVYQTIRDACADTGLQCRRANDIWEESTIIQDIFNLIYRSSVVIVDFTRRNANVLYETGIAHTLGRHVVPIVQDIDEVPFDIKHHRVLTYTVAEAGLVQLRHSLAARLKFLGE